MAYNTPRYDYGTASANLAQRHSAEQAAQSFGTFLGQQRFRRQSQDADMMFRRNLPRVAGEYNRRGAYNSGLRREAQQQYVGDYGRQQQRATEDEASMMSQAAMADTYRQAAYQAALQQLFEQYAVQRAQVDPFAYMTGVV